MTDRGWARTVEEMATESLDPGVVDVREFDIPPLSLLVDTDNKEGYLRLRYAILAADPDINTYEAGHVVSSVFGIMRSVAQRRRSTDWEYENGWPLHIDSGVETSRLEFLPGQGITWRGGDMTGLFAELEKRLPRKKSYGILNLFTHLTE